MSEKNETQSSNNSRRYTLSSVRTTINVIIVVCVSVVFLLVGIFVLDGVNGKIENTVAYWTQKVLSGVGSLMILFACANITEEALKRKNAYYSQRIRSLDEHYTLIMNNGETAQIELYLTNKNKRNKYHAYLRRYKRLMQLAKGKRLKAYYERKLLLSPDEVWNLEFPKIRYHKLTFDKLISGASSVTPNDESSDIDIHRMRYVFQKTLWKVICIIGFGCYVPDLIYHFNSFDNSMIMPLIFKIVVVLWSVYSGVCFGYTMVDRILIVLKRKLVVFSEFRNRTDNNPNVDDVIRYAVTIERDKVVEKLKAKYKEDDSVIANINENEANEDSDVSPFKFRPISPGNLAKKLIVKHFKGSPTESNNR